MDRKEWVRLQGLVPADVLRAARAVSEALRAEGLRHTLVGGIAVALRGAPRATHDVDVMVAIEARDRGWVPPITSVPVDVLVTEGHPLLDAALRLPVPGDVPVVELDVLVWMKLGGASDVGLVAGRDRDLRDVVALLRSGPVARRLLDWFAVEAPEWTDDLKSWITIAATDLDW